MKERNLIIFLIVLLAAGFGLRLYNAFTFNVFDGHDPSQHRAVLSNIMQFRPSQYFCAAYFYIWNAAHVGLGVLFWHPLVLLRVSSPELVLLSLANAHLLFWCILGIWRLGSHWSFSYLEKLSWLALVIAFPVIQRTFNMMRPENLMIALTPWLILWAHQWVNDVQQRGLRLGNARFWLVTLSCAVFATQKIGGITFVAPLLLTALLIMKQSASRWVSWGSLFMTFVLFTVLLTILHRTTSGVDLWVNPFFGRPDYSHSAPISFYFTWNPLSMWENPFRNEHRGSMPNILLVDLFGDYWRYGIDHMSFNKSSGEAWRLMRARFGLMAGLVFVTWYLYAAFRMLAAALRFGKVDLSDKTSRFFPESTVWADVTICLLPVLGGLFYIGASALVLYNPDKGDIIKWEYIGWCLPLLPLPVIWVLRSVSEERKRFLIFWGMTGMAVTGLIQSLMLF